MKTIDIDEILNDIAIKNGYESFMDAARIGNIHYVPLIAKEAAQEYAKQCCDEQIKACAENATAYAVYSSDDDGTYDGVVSKNSILSTPNVVTTKP